MVRADDPAGLLRRWARSSIAHPERTHRAMLYVGVVFFTLLALFPFYWLLVLALTPNDLIVNVGLFPRGFNVEVFLQVVLAGSLPRYVFNGLVVAAATTAVVLVVASLAGYAFGRLEFRGKRPLLVAFLCVSLFPPVAFLLPLFKLFTGNVEVLGVSSPVLFNTPGALVIPFSALFMPLSVFVLTTFYSQIPDGLEAAARVEGCTRIGALVRVVVPLASPGLSTAGVLTFIAVYSEFFFSYLMNDGRPDHWAPLAWAFLEMPATLVNWMAAGTIVGVLPVAALVVVAQEKIVSGLTAGALDG